MEVHAHTHTPRKKWKHYFWEFLMLFLAVFCGFLAENQREHMIEHNREIQFIRSLIDDVTADTSRLNEIINSRNIRDEYLDSLTGLLNSDSAAQNTGSIYFFIPNITRNVIVQFTSNDGTMQQLKNSGALRLIRNRRVSDSIVRYDASTRSLIKISDQENDIINTYRSTVWKVINSVQLARMTNEDNIPQRVNYNPPLESGYRQHLNEFNYRILSVINMNKAYRRESRKLLRQATNLLITLKNEYNLE
jgi:hypothetical protein